MLNFDVMICDEFEDTVDMTDENWVIDLQCEPMKPIDLTEYDMWDEDGEM